MNIVSENHWEFIEGRLDNVRVNANSLLASVKRDHKSVLASERATTRYKLASMQHEFDVCRNALMITLDGNKDAVLDAYDQAYRSRAKNKGWLY